MDGLMGLRKISEYLLSTVRPSERVLMEIPENGYRVFLDEEKASIQRGRVLRFVW
jgi:hypothetical protein